jgi:5'-methylthioadenosine phosphorylase
MQAEIGIIGGTGLYDPQLLKNVEEVTVETPYGAPSDAITVGELAGRSVAFLPRHGKKHTIRPTDVNSRANVFALKKLGVKRIIDRTTKREQSFYTGNKVCHISVAEPMCPEMRKTLIAITKDMGIRAHPTGTYVCIEGPRFSTKAESKLFRSWDADIIGMTLVPECVLAREAELCYASISTVTDYDVWKDHVVSADEVVATMKASVEKVKRIIFEACARLPKECSCECTSALKGAFL